MCTTPPGQQLVQVYYRTFNKVAGRGQVKIVDCYVAPGASVVAILEAASKVCGRTLLSRFGQVGVFEIQTDEGIWSHPGEAERCVLTKGVEFKTWDQPDQEG